MQQRHEGLVGLLSAWGLEHRGREGCSSVRAWEDHLHAPVVPEVVDLEALFDHFDWKIFSSTGCSDTYRFVIVTG
jgi:hypothetical protein